MAEHGVDPGERRLTRADLEEKFKKLQEDVQGKISDKRESVVAAAAGAGVVIFLVAYLLGRRSGKRRRRNIEFRGF